MKAIAEVDNGFTETEIGIFPEDWSVVKLEEVASYINGYPFKPGHWKTVGQPIIRIQNLTNSSNTINYFDGALEDRYKVRNGDLLISWSASLGIFKWNRGNAWLNQHIFKVDNYSSKLWKDFFYYVVMTKLEAMRSKTRGSTMKHITKKEFLAIFFPLPSLLEQKKIASVLSTIQEAKEKTENVIKATKELKKSMMKHLFTYGPVSIEDAEKVPLKKTEIGMIPEHWEVGKLKSIAEVITKGSSPNWQGFDYCDSGIIFVRSQNIGWGRLELDDIALLSEEFNKKEKRSIIKEHDLLINIVGASIGRAAIANKAIEGGNLNQAIAIVRLNINCNPYFVMNFLFTENGQIVLHKEKKDIARANLSLQDIGNIPIPLPPINEQQRIVEVISAIDDKINAEESKRSSLDSLFKTLLSLLMTGKLRVKDLEIPV